MIDQQISNLDAYHSAIVRIATVRDNSGGGHAYLLFASIELIAAGRPVPESTPTNERGLPHVYRSKATDLNLAFRRVALDAVGAVAWYRSLAQNPTLPIPQLEAERGKYDGTAIRAAPLVDEPTWPSLSTPLADPTLFGSADDFYPTPFIGPGARPARVHRQLAARTPLIERVIEDPDVRTWLRQRIHFDVARHDELVGGAVLVVPDPDVRAVRTFMTRNADGQEHLVGEVLARRGRTLRDLTLTLFEERFGAMHLFNTSKVANTLVIVPTSDQLEHTGHALSHIERGLVDQRKALPYIRSIGLNMGVIGRRVRIETQEGRRKASKPVAHDINEVTRATDTIGLRSASTTPRDAISRFYESSERRQQQRLARRQDLQWFDRRDTALSFIRGRIGNARETVLIIDPYADGKDLFDFGHFVTRVDIQLRLLTSSLPFKNDSMMQAGFREALRSFSKRGLPTPEIKIMRGGKKPPIHDRFLLIDGDVWLSGNSLNTIGTRASVMIKLPDPGAVRKRLERLFAEAKSISIEGRGQ
ncbi:VPA1262 family N-terminal domain-containing protein [Arvimicrobium flavum]|uniref:VPA1262 family N-terminal domain-containing protein n=1 Tax=Arvimicrobium flavum TaxID=3393320 RepID=UPI00237AFFE5|nr:VPA1262 family N-terminal domain-containing protein [Mesorhizobium shangrilense]